MYKKLKKEIEQLKEDYYYECQVINDVIEWQETFYLDIVQIMEEIDKSCKEIK